jgi:hypothetical protein
MASSPPTQTPFENDIKVLADLGLSGPAAAMPAKDVWHTPRKLQLALALTCLATLIFFPVAQSSVAQFHNAMKTVGHDSAPSIVMAERIKAGLADMDADVANELIAHPGQNASSLADYESNRKQVTDNLVSAAENITYGDAERVPIQTIEEGLGVYEAFVAQARVFHKRGGDPEVLPSYHQATLEMHTVLLPAADALDKANHDMMTLVYAQHKDADGRALGLVWLTGLLLLAALFAVQIFLVKRMRRLINPLLAIATLLALGFLIFTTASLHEESIHLKVAKEDSFDSVYALWHARAIAYDANAAESRWLLDRGYGVASAGEFFSGIGQLAAFGPGESYESLADHAQQVHVGAGDWPNQVPPDFHGYLADEMRNITFDGEQEGVVATMRALGTYVAIDGQIRQDQNAGRHADAIALCVGDNPGQSDWAFEQFDSALGSIIDLNQKQFDLAVSRGDEELAPFDWLTPTVCIAIAALALLGVLPRIREYHA